MITPTQYYRQLNQQFLQEHQKILSNDLYSFRDQYVPSKEQQRLQIHLPQKFTYFAKTTHLRKHIYQRQFKHDEHLQILKKMDLNIKIWRIFHKLCCLLDLTNLDIGLYGILNLGHIKHIHKVTVLKLGSNFIGDEGLRILASRQWDFLEEFILENNYISGKGIKHILMGRWENIQKLNLSHNPLGEEGIKYLSKWKNIKKLRALELENCSILGNQLNPLLYFGFSANNKSKLKYLNIKNNRIDYWGLVSLAYLVKACPFIDCILIGNNNTSLQDKPEVMLPFSYDVA